MSKEEEKLKSNYVFWSIIVGGLITSLTVPNKDHYLTIVCQCLITIFGIMCTNSSFHRKK